jgi:16S rRNA (cytosine1402-N4)-methyltransferase
LADVEHVPVLLEETLRYLAPERGGLFVDCTVGLGGHAAALLERAPGARLLGIDRDPEALAVAGARLARFGDRARLVEANFHRLGAALAAAGVAARPAGVLADLGVSSLQLERAARGFSFRLAGPLDMRMGPGGRTAADIVNRSPEGEMERIFRDYGEEHQARRIARAIVHARERAPIATTTELAELVRRAKGTAAGRREGPRRDGKIDPATRVFQALRIAVNEELEGLRGFVEEAARLLELEGRLVIISYHSGEDRIVKNALRDLDRGEIDPVTGRPLAETRLIEVLTKKPVRPSAAEVAFNPRSRSARLRAARRI